MKRAGGTLLLVLTVAFPVAACGGGAPSPLPATSDVPKAAASAPASDVAPPAPTAPTIPNAAQGLSAANAEEFARYWFELAEHAYRTGDTAPMMRYASSDCSACLAIEREVASVYAAGGRFEDVAIDVVSAAAPPPDDRGTIVTAVLQEAASRAVASDGSIIDQTSDAREQGINVFVTPSDDSWQVFDVGFVE